MPSRGIVENNTIPYYVNMRDYPVRKGTKLAGYDYSQGEPCFITLCTFERQALFGALEDGEMRLSPAGCMLRERWLSLPAGFPDLILDEFLIMPDHFHAILGFARVDTRQANKSGVYGVIRTVQYFKTDVMRAYAEGVRHGWPRYREHLWQRSFYDHIIRNQADLERHREYVYNNAIASLYR